MIDAYFDADGVCVRISDIPCASCPGGAVRKVARGIQPSSIWFDGETVRESTPIDLPLPDSAELAGPSVGMEIPAGSVAIVNGEAQRGTLTIPCDEERDYHVVVKGRYHGSAVVRVQSYAAARREQYPEIGDQLDALWKAIGGQDPTLVAAMLEQIQAVKAANPKPLET